MSHSKNAAEPPLSTMIMGDTRKNMYHYQYIMHDRRRITLLFFSPSSRAPEHTVMGVDSIAAHRHKHFVFLRVTITPSIQALRPTQQSEFFELDLFVPLH